ncbi:MAG TPA: nitroreductase family protein [Spirochaetota bacterium]|nr:nitroreductase family protein [Spirochaetota bacterium]
MSVITFDMKSCTGCGTCEKDCPMGIIEFTGKSPSIQEKHASSCISCGHCASVCPYGSIAIDGSDPGRLDNIDQEILPSAEQMSLAIRARRSVRSFRTTPVQENIVTSLVNTARYAPTSGNSQLVGWTIIRTPGELRRITEHVIDYIRFLAASDDPAAAAYRFADMVKDWEQGQDRIFRGAPAVVLTHAPLSHGAAAVDCAIALTCFDLAAFSAGLGTCWCGFFMMAYRNWEPLRKAIPVPEGHYYFGAMMLGYPSYKYKRIPPRKNAVINWM